MSRKRKEESFLRRGQSFVEYLILMAVVITVLMIFLGSQGLFQKQYNAVIEKQGADLESAAKRIFK